MTKKVRFFQLQKQYLLYRTNINNYLKIVKENIGLHSTDYLTPYLSLWARVEKFDPQLLFNSLNEDRVVIRLRAFRGTVFLIHRNNLEYILSAAQLFLGNRLRENYNYGKKQNVDFKTLEKSIIGLFSQHNFLSAGEIRKKLTGVVDIDHLPLAMRVLDVKGIIARTRQKHLLDNRTQYALMKNWITDLEMENINPEKALEIITLNYIKNFGPVCEDDICWWFPLKKSQLGEILVRLKNKLAEFNFNSITYWMEKEQYKNFLDYKTPNPTIPVVNFLPYEDHYPKAYIQRNWYISQEESSFVYVKEKKTDFGQIRPSIWIDGEIVGRWEYEWVDKKKSAVKVEIKNIRNQILQDEVAMNSVENKRKELEDYMNEKVVTSINIS